MGTECIKDVIVLKCSLTSFPNSVLKPSPTGEVLITTLPRIAFTPKINDPKGLFL